MKINTAFLIPVFFASLAACNNDSTNKVTTTDSSSVKSNEMPDKKSFEAIIDGKQTNLFILKNHNGMEAAITNYGARLVGLWVPDKNKKLTNVEVGFKSIEDYEKSTEPCFGATIGRFCNPVAKGKFTIDGKQYNLFANKGFQAVVWDAKQVNDSAVELAYLSKDMEEGFPGNLKVKITFSLTGNNGFKCEYEATTDKKTIVNLTNHAFFNLNGQGSGSILNHTVQIYADKYTPVNTKLVPTGHLAPVSDTPFDFTKPTTIGERIEADNEQLKNGKGYDHNFVLNGPKEKGMNHAATVTGDKSGIVMDIYTQEPGLQFYSGNFMESKNTFSDGSKDDFRTAFAMETQHFPDSPNQPSFPSTVLKPGDVYKTTSLYVFSLD